MGIAFLWPFLFAAILLALVARAVVYRARPHDINHVILFVRKLDISDLDTLLDAGQDWTLRRSLGPEAFRIAHYERICLLREYLRRIAHNVRIIQLWIAGEYDLIKDKRREQYSEKDLLIAEALQVAVELRLYSLAAGVKVWFWSTFRMHQWPQVFVPHLPGWRVQCGIDLSAKYRRLTEITAIVSIGYGKTHHERLLDAL